MDSMVNFHTIKCIIKYEILKHTISKNMENSGTTAYQAEGDEHRSI